MIVSGDVNDVVRLAAASNDDPGPAQGIAFTLGGDTPAQQVLVVRTGPESAFIDANSVVHVTGAVREFDVEAFNRAYGNADWFSGGRFEQWNGRTAIVAQSIDPTIPPEYIRP